MPTISRDSLQNSRLHTDARVNFFVTYLQDLTRPLVEKLPSANYLPLGIGVNSTDLPGIKCTLFVPHEPNYIPRTWPHTSFNAVHNFD